MRLISFSLEDGWQAFGYRTRLECGTESHSNPVSLWVFLVFFSPLNFLVCVCVYIYINNKQVMQGCLVSIHKTGASPICICLRIVSNLVVVGVAGAQMPTIRFKAG